MPTDPLRLDCSPCHIPEPIYERGLDSMVMARADRHHEGVGCIACHAYRGESNGAGPTREAPCNPRHEPTMRASITCSPCHALHGTLDEWAASPQGKAGITCQDCHMPAVVRDEAGETMPRGRHHTIRGGSDPAMLRRALTVGIRLSHREVEVTLLNDGTSHAVPGEINNRQLVLHVDVAGPGGDFVRTDRTFQAPPRVRRGLLPTTQIMPGQTVTQRAAIDPFLARAVVSLEYRSFFLMPAPPYRVDERVRIRMPGFRIEIHRRRA